MDCERIWAQLIETEAVINWTRGGCEKNKFKDEAQTSSFSGIWNWDAFYI